MNGKLIKLVKDLIWMVGFIAVVFLLMVLFGEPAPDIHVSHSTGKCVKMITAEGVEQSCPAELPKRYNHVFVK